MDTLQRICAGLDVHKDTVVACIRWLDDRDRVHTEVRTFGTTTPDLLDWLRSRQVPIVAMESTGVYWKPLFNLLEGTMEVLLVNPEHIKKVPGRKTDVKDCAWIAQLLQHGLLKASFVPGRPIRELRDLTRQRTQLTGEKASVANRIQKVLEDANLKLAAVASDILGVSGRQMLGAIIAGETDPRRLADLAKRKLRRKQAELEQALDGRVKPHHRLLLRELLDHVDYLDAAIARVSAAIEERTRPFETALVLLCSIAGVQRRTAEVLLAEIGPDMSRFPSARHLCSWAAICPGNHESGGKRRSGRTRHGDRWLRAALLQAAWAATRVREGYFGAQFRRIARRRGEKRAAVAVAHALLTVAYHVLKDGRPYHEPGAAYFDRLEPGRLARYHVRRLAELGYDVQLAPRPAA
jgi:transposase